ncbi:MULTISPECIES: tRNA uridine-5-carboxymethylaminomethyl(34) synthesis GTPase MnmE [Terrabacteria group]|uniref:tRNA uridine-5-carboxymethylaminomethyl(34) synthesis GTPase MnmE n=1 Tax=Bacillati TaxID=1783272 RepID=UPI001C6E5EC0|nr:MULTISPECIES: tRNA uridine-5-carboxymethylaminomethyl(34) synthesis GTPase MnmE [Terrabacteria group]MBW9212475.1 tRNA uridine-5-carboxymethylaminomethyl(34) synthesis GTPase MnmE [Trueperella sp. zg.1013]
MSNDTIVAISTADAMAAVSIIRISGPDTFSMVEKLCHKDVSKVAGYRLVRAEVFEQEEVVDDILVAVFHHPRSYTGEDVVELNCHGGVYLTHKILQLILGLGARLAKRGEFTQRAFLNEKMDLSQAEAIQDLIVAEDEINTKSAIHTLKGSILRVLKPLEEDLIQMIAHIEVNINYPEYDDVEVLVQSDILPKARVWRNQLKKLVTRSEKAQVVKNGIQTAIVGRPNVGKSSLLNALLEEDKAIVTDIAGTTRDIVEGNIRIGSFSLHLIDTAGIRESHNQIEQIGIEKSKQMMKQAQLILLVLDGSQELTLEDQELLEQTKDKTRIIIYNKKDLGAKYDGVQISAANGDVEELIEKIEELFQQEVLAANGDTLANDRQIGLAKASLRAMDQAIEALEAGMELDLVTVDLQESWNCLKDMSGGRSRENLLDEIFSRFCLGK